MAKSNAARSTPVCPPDITCLIGFTCNSPEQIANANLLCCQITYPESTIINREVRIIPDQRRKVYELTRFEENSASDIAVMLNLSQRTVENHLRMGREEVRKYIRQCI
jgi:hypothetical protein